MSRTTSAALARQIYLPHSDIPLLPCVQIEEASLGEVIRVVHNTESIVRDIGGSPETFVHYFFGMELPPEDGETLGQTRLIIDNIAEEFGLAMLLVTGKPKVTMDFVLANDVDTVEFGPLVFYLDNGKIDNMQVSAGAIGSHGLHQQHPAEIRSPSSRPQIFQ